MTHSCLDEFTKKWDGAIEKTIGYDLKTQTFSSSWMIRLYKLTKAGNISNSGGGYLRIEYCPMCGVKVNDDD